eukprot:431801_1
MAALIPLCVYLMLLQAVSFTRFNITEETKLQTMNWSSIMCVDKQPKSNNKPISSIILYCKYDDMHWIINNMEQELANRNAKIDDSSVQMNI